MELVQMLMNIILPPIALIMLLFTLPPYLLFKFISSIIRFTNSENVAGKVVLITGASSGIGEYIAYEYARRGACLVLAARREERLRQVADKARRLGSPDVLVIRTDVSNVEDSKRLVHEAVKHFGRIDHLVNNAGIFEFSMLEDSPTVSDFAPIMEINFWGSVYSTHFAVPHLRKSKGKIVVIASAAGWFPPPKMSIYNASKAALIALYDTLRIEFGSDIGITIVTPGLIESEMCHEENLSKVHANFLPVASTEGSARAIVNGACRGNRYLTEPHWVSVGFLLELLCPEVVEWCYRRVCITRSCNLETDATSNKREAEKFLHPASIQSPGQRQTETIASN